MSQTLQASTLLTIALAPLAGSVIAGIWGTKLGGDKLLAAQLLGITARTIYRREAEWRGEDPGDF